MTQMRSIPRDLFSLTTIVALALALAGLAGCGVPPDAPAEDPPAADVADEGGSSALQGDPVNGKEEFTVCAGCHGPDGKGLPNLGKDLHANAFLGALSDDEAVAFLKVGRPASDPLNTTGVVMPPKGGNPAMTDQDLYDVVSYVRTLK